MIGVARKFGVHRLLLHEVGRNAVPAQRKKTQRPAVKMCDDRSGCVRIGSFCTGDAAHGVG